MIAGVLIAYAEQPGLTLDELKAGFEGLVSLFTLLEEPVVVRDRRIISFPDMRVSDYACEDRWLSTQRHGAAVGRGRGNSGRPTDGGTSDKASNISPARQMRQSRAGYLITAASGEQAAEDAQKADKQ